VSDVLVATYPLASNTTLNAFVNYNKGQIVTQGCENYTIISNQSVTFAGKPAYNMIWQATVSVQLNRTATKNLTVEVNKTFMINNDTGYVVTDKASPNDYNTYLSLAQRIMNSFVLK